MVSKAIKIFCGGREWVVTRAKVAPFFDNNVKR